jgi:hypothetical protein
LAVIDSLHESNRALQAQLAQAETHALVAQSAAGGPGQPDDDGRGSPLSPHSAATSRTGSRHTTPERDREGASVARLINENQKLSMQLAASEAASKREEAARGKQAAASVFNFAAVEDAVFDEAEVSPPFDAGDYIGGGGGGGGGRGGGNRDGAAAYQHVSQSVQSGRMDDLIGQVNL